eukprot:1708635-Ditylum_brightwellii.AAC.1
MAIISAIVCWIASLSEKEEIGMVCGTSLTVSTLTSAAVSSIKHLGYSVNCVDLVPRAGAVRTYFL